jgi:antitoxin component HigA of HigAB toxin-antitoxin module
MDIKPIKNTRDYRRALKEIEGLVHAKRAWEARHYRLIPILTLSNPWLPSRGVRWT